MRYVEVIVFALLLIDSISCNAIAWTGEERWYHKHFRVFSRYFPATKGWCTYYLILVLWIGVLLLVNGVF
ncbi:MAG: hypothetical protein M1320_00210 [Patescibacteria group bacterium]|nr:hypothetical protein [Patescibacteria group bacterium]